MSELRDRTISGFFWSFLEKIGARGINFVVFLILARLLTPADFGLIAMLSIFIELSQKLSQAGFGEALIQKKDTDDEDYSSVFYINMAVSFILYGVLYFTAPFIADFYHQPALIQLTRVLSLIFIINAFSFVQDTRLKKNMRFKTLAIIHIPAMIIGGAVSIYMAYEDFGVWSLVAFQLTYRLVYAIQLWIYAKWKPYLSFNIKKVKRLFSFGSNMMVASMLGMLLNNAYLVIIGKFFPIATLGYYENAWKLYKTPTGVIRSIVTTVTFPAFSAIQDENRRLKDWIKKVSSQLSFWIIPVFIFAGILATPIFRFVLTDKWLPAVPFFQFFCIIAAFGPISTYNLEILKVKGRSDLLLKVSIFSKIITGIGIVLIILLHKKIWYLVGFQVFSIVFQLGFYSLYSGKLIQYTIWRQLRDLLPIFILGIISGAIVWVVDYNISGLSDILRILIGFSIGVGSYWFLAYKIKLEAYEDITRIISEKTRNNLI